MKISVFTVRGAYNDIRLGHKIACCLSSAGYDVTIVAKVADCENYQGLTVRRAWAPFNSIFRWILNAPLLMIQAVRLKSDLYLLSNPDTIPMAFFLSLIGKRVIYDTGEDFSKRPQIRDAVPHYLQKSVGRCLTRMERSLAQRVDLISITQPQQRDSLGGNSIMIENAPLIEGPVIAEALALREKLPQPEIFSLLYIGGLTEYRGLFTMLDLVGRINESKRCRLKLIGGFGDKRTEELARAHRCWHLVDYLGIRTHSETLAHVHRADIGLALLHDVADHATTSVTKLYEYMWAGLPFVATNFPRWQASVAGVEAGFFSDPHDTYGLVRDILALAEDSKRITAMGEAGERYIQSSFNWTITGARLIKAVDGILGHNPRHAN